MLATLPSPSQVSPPMFSFPYHLNHKWFFPLHAQQWHYLSKHSHSICVADTTITYRVSTILNYLFSGNPVLFPLEWIAALKRLQMKVFSWIFPNGQLFSSFPSTQHPLPPSSLWHVWVPRSQVSFDNSVRAHTPSHARSSLPIPLKAELSFFMSFGANWSLPSIFLAHQQLHYPPVSKLLSPHPFHRTILTILQIWYVSYGPHEATDHVKRGWFELEVCWMCETNTGFQRQREQKISNISLNFLYWVMLK